MPSEEGILLMLQVDVTNGTSLRFQDQDDCARERFICALLFARRLRRLSFFGCEAEGQ